MIVGSPPFHLTYSTRLHAGERWADVRAMLERHVLPVRTRIARGRPFGLGLWLPGRAAMDLEEPRAAAQLREWLDRNDVYVFTLNAAPYGRFQGAPLKTGA
jgi:hypothetical protein